MKSPFKFLDYFTLADHDCFFGREEETRQLFDMVNKNRLVLVYGQSGTGKTSLVHCGLASQFNATDWMPVFIRRESNINDSLQAALAKALRLDRAEGDLLQTVQSVYTRYLRPVYLIFDQFEELFILGDAHEQQAFIRQMAELYESETSCQMLFIIREEFLASLYEFEKTVPTLFDRRLRVEPMSDKKVQTVLRESFKQFHITLENPERNIRQIIDKVSGEKSIIQLPYLQVYLDQFWQDDFDRTYTQPGIEPPADLPYPPLVFETQEIEAFGAIGDVLAKYLDQQKNNLQQLLDSQYNQLKGNEVARILDVFVTAKGTKRPVTMIRKGKMIELQGIPTGILDDLPPQLIADGLGMLEDSRILRINGANIELAHDKLAELIEHYRTDEDRKLESDRQLIEAAYDTHLRTGEYMSRKALLLVEDSLQKLKLPETQLQFIEAATADALMREDSERAEAINRAQEAEERIILAETARKNAKRFSYAIAVILLITGSFVFKIFQINAENNAKKIERLSREKQLLLEKAKAEDEFKKYYYGVLLFNEIDQNLESMQYEEAYALLLKVFHPKVRRDTISGTVIAVDSMYLQRELQFEFPKKQLAERLLELSLYFHETGLIGREQLLFDQLIATTGHSFSKFNDNYAKLDSFLLTDSLRLNCFEDSCFTRCARKYFPAVLAVNGGSFSKGCNGNDCKTDELPLTPENVDTLYMGCTEVTNHQYNLYLVSQKQKIKDISPSGWSIKGSNPVVKVDWYDAVLYCNWLSKRLLRAPCYNIDRANKDALNKRRKDFKKWTVSINEGSNGFRLPTENEWEYAARGGMQDYMFAGGQVIDSLGWCRENSKNAVHAVALLKPNSFGLYDMSGNACEWCWDWYHPSGYSLPVDSLENAVKYARVCRGGSWYNAQRDCRVFSRFGYREKTVLYDELAYGGNGFRVARNY